MTLKWNSFENQRWPVSQSTSATFIPYKSLLFLTLLLSESRQQSFLSGVSGSAGQESAFIQIVIVSPWSCISLPIHLSFFPCFGQVSTAQGHCSQAAATRLYCSIGSAGLAHITAIIPQEQMAIPRFDLWPSFSDTSIIPLTGFLFCPVSVFGDDPSLFYHLFLSKCHIISKSDL